MKYKRRDLTRQTTPMGLSRRDLLTAIIASGAGGVALTARSVAATTRDLETTRIRLPSTRGICGAPMYAADELLRAEGFTDVQYVKVKTPYHIEDALASGDADLSVTYGLRWVYRLDSGIPVTVVAGIHPGCNELFVTDRIRSLRDLHGRTIAIGELGGLSHQLLSMVLAYIGLDWRNDVKSRSTPPPTKSGCSAKERSMHCSRFLRSRRSCAHARSVMCCSTPAAIGRGRSTSAACWPRTATSIASILSP